MEEPAEVVEESAGADSAAGAPPPSMPMETTEGRLKRVEEELSASQDRYLRLAADFDNFRKRMARERTEIADRSQAAVLVRVLEVLDDLDRLVAEESAAADGAVLHDAIVLIDKKMRKELQAAGLESLIPDGEPFDPSLHEAVATAPAPDPSLESHVAATFQAGYRFKGQLIRPARVQVYAEGQG